MERENRIEGILTHFERQYQIRQVFGQVHRFPPGILISKKLIILMLHPKE